MKINSLFLLFFFCAIILNGQVEIASFKPITKKPKITEFLSNVNEKGDIATSYFYNNRLYITVLDKEGNVLLKTQRKIPLTGGLPSVEALSNVGAIYEDNKFYHFYNGGLKYKKNYILQIDLDSKKTFLRLIKIGNKVKRLLGGVCNKDNFYILTQNKNLIVIHKFIKKSLEFQAKEFKVTPSIIEYINKDVFFRGFTTINKEEPLQASKASGSNKIYLLEKDEIIITIDGWSGTNRSTFIQFLNWETGKYTAKYLGKGMESIYPQKTNSILFDNYFYHLSLSKDNLSLEIYDFDSFNLINRFDYNTKDSEIAIMKTVFKSIKGTFAKNEIPEILNMLKKGDLYIYLEKKGTGTPLVSIGSYFPGVTGMIGGGFGFPPVPYKSDEKNQYFNTSFPDNKFKINQEALPFLQGASYSYRVKTFEVKILTDRHISSPIYFPQTSTFGLVHYLKSDNTIKITKL